MSKKFQYPVNDSRTLWIPGAEEDRSFGRLLTSIQDHFGTSIGLAELDIEYFNWTLEDPCSCCVGSGVYGDYYKVTIRKERCPYTVNHVLSDLTQD